MSFSKIKIIAPVLFQPGQVKEKSAGFWSVSGEEWTVETELAVQLERDGYVDVISVDGAKMVWSSCCVDCDKDAPA